MAIRIEPFEAGHFRRLVLQPHQSAYRLILLKDEWQALSVAGEAWTAIDDEDVPMACAGVIDRGGGRGEAWAVLAGDIGLGMVPVTRAIQRGFRAMSYRRIEAMVACNFQPGRRWVQMLGFEFEGVARAYMDDGSDGERWARVR
jgi:hypothetical protein